MLLVVPVKDTDEALRFIRERDHPLVVYVFSQDKAFQNKGESRLMMSINYGTLTPTMAQC